MAYGKWELTQEEENYYIPLFKYIVGELKSGRMDSFTLNGINPVQAGKVLEKIGYSYKDSDTNFLDWWQYFEGNIFLFSSGETFELSLCISDEEEQCQ